MEELSHIPLITATELIKKTFKRKSRKQIQKQLNELFDCKDVDKNYRSGYISALRWVLGEE